MIHKVSVVIPSYNHAAYLQQRIETVLNQTLEPVEIIILDDCSTDNSVEIIESYVSKHSQIKFIKNEVNSGSTFAQWNKGVRMAKGNLVWIAESDDVAELTFLQELVNCFCDKDVVLAYCQSKKIDKDNNVTGTWKSHTDKIDSKLFEEDFVMKGELYIEKILIHKNTIPNASAVVFKRELYLKVGLTELPLRMLGDWLVWIKILTLGKVAFLSCELNSFRFHSQSAIAKSVEMRKLHNLYDELHAFSMRKCLIKEIKKGQLFFSKLAIKENKRYYNLELMNMAMINMESKNLIIGWKYIFAIFYFGKFNMSILKRAISATLNSFNN